MDLWSLINVGTRSGFHCLRSIFYFGNLGFTGFTDKVRLHHYICLKGHLSGSLEKA
jgi:hypothetical protein